MIVEASRTINLGKQGDNDYTVVKFDVSGWSAYGDGIFSLNHKRSIDCSAYPCVVSYENGFVYWTIKATDTQFAGNGLAQLVYSNEDGVIIHTEIYNTFVAKSLVTTDTPPEPFRPWVDRITGMIETETAQRMADDEDLANAIDEEAVTRAANDTTLNNKIEAEAQQRAEEDAELWDAIETAGSVRDVQINGTSILDGGVANITGARVQTALGYEPADADGVDRLSESITEISNEIFNDYFKDVKSDIAFGVYTNDGAWSVSSAQIGIRTPVYISEDIKVTYADGYMGRIYTWESANVSDGCVISGWVTGENIITKDKWVTFSLALSVGSTQTLSLDTFWKNAKPSKHNKLDDIRGNIVEVENDIEDLKEISYEDGVNNYDVSVLLTNVGLITASNGSINSYEKGRYSNPVALKKDDSVEYTLMVNGTAYCMIAECTEDGTFVAPVVVGTGSIAIGTYTATKDMYVRFGGRYDYLSSEMVSVYKKIPVKDAVKSLISELHDGTEGLYALFNTVGVIGDSYSAVRLYYRDYLGAMQSWGDHPEYSWGTHMAQKYNKDYKIFAKSGLEASQWLTDTDNGYPVASLSENLCQAYIIALGINDSSRHDTTYIGSTSDIDRANEDNNANSFVGNYAKIIQKMKKLQRGVKIFVLTMGDATSDTNASSYMAYNQAIRDIADFFDNVYLIDLYEKYHDVYAEENGFFKVNTVQGHFTATGYKRVGDMVAKEMSNVIRDYSEEFIFAEYIGTDKATKIWKDVV